MVSIRLCCYDPQLGCDRGMMQANPPVQPPLSLEEITLMNSNTSPRPTQEPSPPKPDGVDPSSEIPAEDALDLPEPDPDNITVLSKKAPNRPILPWNRYDSPWDEADAESSDHPEPDADGLSTDDPDSDDHDLDDLDEPDEVA